MPGICSHQYCGICSLQEEKKRLGRDGNSHKPILCKMQISRNREHISCQHMEIGFPGGTLLLHIALSRIYFDVIIPLVFIVAVAESLWI